MSIGVLVFDFLFIILGAISLYYNHKEKDEKIFSFNIRLLEGFLATFIVATVIFLLIRNNAKYYASAPGNPGTVYMLALIILVLQVIGLVFCLIKKDYKEKLRVLGIIAGYAISVIIGVGVYLFIKSTSNYMGLEPVNFYEMLKTSAGELFTVICTAFVCNNLFVYCMFKDKE